jgi:hypothetical protein
MPTVQTIASRLVRLSDWAWDNYHWQSKDECVIERPMMASGGKLSENVPADAPVMIDPEPIVSHRDTNWYVHGLFQQVDGVLSLVGWWEISEAYDGAHVPSDQCPTSPEVMLNLPALPDGKVADDELDDKQRQDVETVQRYLKSVNVYRW